MFASDHLSERRFGVRIGYYNARADLFSRIQFNAQNFSVLDQNPLHSGLQPDLTPRPFQRPNKRPRNRERTAQRIEAAVEVVMGDARVHEGRDLRRRQSMIARLPRQHSAQNRIADVRIDQIRAGGTYPLENVARAPGRFQRLFQITKIS